jgi:hypothetical protein
MCSGTLRRVLCSFVDIQFTYRQNVDIHIICRHKKPTLTLLKMYGHLTPVGHLIPEYEDKLFSQIVDILTDSNWVVDIGT